MDNSTIFMIIAHQLCGVEQDLNISSDAGVQVMFELLKSVESLEPKDRFERFCGLITAVDDQPNEDSQFLVEFIKELFQQNGLLPMQNKHEDEDEDEDEDDGKHRRRRESGSGSGSGSDDDDDLFSYGENSSYDDKDIPHEIDNPPSDADENADADSDNGMLLDLDQQSKSGSDSEDNSGLSFKAHFKKQHCNDEDANNVAFDTLTLDDVLDVKSHNEIPNQAGNRDEDENNNVN
jgi:hypothetical protein